MSEPYTLRDINFFTTYRCNSRCMNCQIWKHQGLPENKKPLCRENLQKLFDDPLFQNCPNVGLAGGEPTISPFFWELLDCIPEDKHITITTNALSSRRLISFFEGRKDSQRYMVQLSLDGIGPVNDRIRGIEGAYEKTLNLLDALEETGVKRLVSFTINRLNIHQLSDCYELARSYNAIFSTRMAYFGGAYENDDQEKSCEPDEKQLDELDAVLKTIIQKEIETPDHSPESLVFISKIVDYHRGKQKDLPCRAMESALVIDLYGDVFPNCPAIMTSLGSLHETSLSDIWQGEKSGKARKAVSAFACGGCWNDCQVITNIRYQKKFLQKEYAVLKTAAFARLSASGQIDINREDHHFFLLDGWYSPEGNPGTRYRWTGPQFSILVPPGTTGLEMLIMAPDIPSEIRGAFLSVCCGDNKASIELNRGEWVTSSCLLQKPFNTVTPCHFSMDTAFSPRENGNSADSRSLGAAVRFIRFLSPEDM